MKQLLSTIALLCTFSIHSAAPRATYGTTMKDLFSAYVDGEKHEITGLVLINSKLFVEIRSHDGTAQLIGDGNRVYAMPDFNDLQGIDFNTPDGKELKDRGYYKSQLFIAKNNPKVILGSLFMHSFGLYGAYKLCKKLYKHFNNEKPHTHPNYTPA